MVHPATRILLFVILAAALSWLSAAGLALVAVIFLPWALLRAQRFFRFLYRLRYVLLAMVAVHALTFGTAFDGETLSQLGLTLARLLLVIALLCVLVSALPREHLLSGLVVLLEPLARFGVPAERIAIRLALTLSYAEQARGRGWHELLHDLNSPPGPAIATVSAVPRLSFSYIDPALIALCCALVALL